jgi:hypothetical protein
MLLEDNIVGRLVCIEGKGNIELHGYLEDAGNGLLLMHYHGLAGNFYENSFIHHFIRESLHRGISFMSVNSRAHDYLSDAHIGGSLKVLRCGAAHSKLFEIRSDLEAWVRFAVDHGFTSIVLQGHSAGAVSVADYLLHGDMKANIVAAVFASPTDMVGVQIDIHGKQGFDNLLMEARKLVAEGNPHLIMPDKTFPGYVLDAETYLNLYEPNGLGDLFDFRTPQRLRMLRSIGRPILCFFGNVNDVCSLPVKTALQNLRNELLPAIETTISVIEGASHSYRGFETYVTLLVFNWILQLKNE